MTLTLERNRWWRSFLVSGSTGFYVFVYGIIYYMTKLHIDNGPSSFLYFGYTFLMSLLVFLMTVWLFFVVVVLLLCFWTDAFVSRERLGSWHPLPLFVKYTGPSRLTNQDWE